jgi:hypothetical protein
MLRFACLLFAIPLLADETCLSIEASHVTPRDLAPRLPGFATVTDPGLFLAPSPQAGQSRTVPVPELAAWARRVGVSSSVLAPLCLVRQARRLLKSDVEAAVRAQLPAAAGLEIFAYSTDLLPLGHGVFPLATASRPSLLHPQAAFRWDGYWEANDGKRVPIWARVSAWRIRAAIRLKSAGQERAILRADNLEQVAVTASVFDLAPDESISTYAGQILKRFLPMGYVLDPRQVEPPPCVARNSMVEVHVVSGQLHLDLVARAESDGWIGDSVALVIPAGRRRFRAVIQPDGSALLVVNTRQAPLRAENSNGSARISN